MKVAVAGATGVVGCRVVEELLAGGHEVAAISRSSGVDLVSGTGLADALAGCSAVIDVSSTSKISTKGSIDFFTRVTENLLAAERNIGITHHVALSIIGAEKTNSAYYAGKAAQERLLIARPDGWSMLRTTQFHEFAQQLVHRSRGPIMLVPTMRSQPVSSAEVAAELVDIAIADPRGLATDLAGPREERMADLVRRYLSTVKERKRIIEVPVPGRWGTAMRDGTILPGPQAKLGAKTFDDWLATL